METGVLMKALLLFLASPLFGAITVSNPYVSDVSHGTTLVHFTVANNTPNGDGTLFNFARICYATASGGCVSGTGRKYMPTSYPNNTNVETRKDTTWRIILTGLSASTAFEICPELSMDKTTWVRACTTLTTPGRPAEHPVRAELPRGTIPTAPTDYTGFHAGASTGGAVVTTTPYAITACSALQSDINAAVDNQTSFGTIITLAAGQANKCSGRFYPTKNPQDIRVFGSGNVSTVTNKITIASHNRREGDAVQFSSTYSDLPGEFYGARDCTGIKPAEVYYAHNVTTNDFELT